MRKEKCWKNIALSTSMMLILLIPLNAKSNSEIKTNEHITQTKAIDQTVLVKGVVTDLSGPVIGASVIIKGTNVGIITDIDGRFVLDNVKVGSEIVITFIGYKKKVIQIKNGQPLSITLVEDSQQLQELVIIGYGQQKKSI